MQKNNKKHESNQEIRDYWFNKLSGELPTLNLPSSKLRPNVKSDKGVAFRAVFSKLETEKLHSFVSYEEASLFSCLLATLNILLYRYTSQRDIILGTRIIDEIDENIGNKNDLFCNTLIFREALEPLESFNSFYDRVKKSQLSDYARQLYSFEQLVTDLDIISDNSRNAIFDIRVTFNKAKFQSNDLDNILNSQNSINDLGERNSKLDIEITFQETQDVLFFDIVYNTDLYESDMIKRFIIHFKTLILNLIAQPSNNVDEVNYVSEQEQHQLLNVFNKPNTGYPKDKTIVDIFLSQVEKTPDNIAVVFENKKITYKELDNLSNQFANYIISVHGITTEDFVSVMFERSEWIVICFLGILKSGAAYVPIDPKYPTQRKEYIQNDSQCKITIDKNLLNEFINTIETHSFIAPNNVQLSPDNLCYIIYTSGTTGNPKGVMIKHQNVVQLFFNDSPLFDFNHNDVWCMFHSFCFDFSVWEMYGALLFGGKLIVVPELTAKDSTEFMSMIESEGVTVLNQTPSAFINLMEIANNRKTDLNLRYIIFGGEALFPKNLEKWHQQYPKIEFINMYGITETTVHVTYKKIEKTDIDSNISNIGKCLPTLSAYILNEFKTPQPIGVIGELFISGSGLAKGYLNRKELTAEKFLPNPFVEGERMYSSGDLARWLPNGDIEYMGRKDDQVKIRGHRIELGEIDHALMSINGIKSAVVLAKTDILVAFIVADFEITEEIDQIRLWKNELSLKLPVFMVPHVFTILEKLPTTSNGKIDKKLLLEYKAHFESKNNYTAPRTEQEKIVASIWKECLDIENIDISTDFFEMGGHSIKAVKAIIEIEKRTGKRIPLSAFLEHNTIEKFAKLLHENNEIIADCLVPIKPTGNKVPLFMIHGGGLDVLCFVNMSKHFDDDQPFYAIQGVGAKGYDEWYESIEAMAAHYINAIVKVNPTGPYALAGFCIGGIVAFEMAKQLRKQGKEVSNTIVLDSHIGSSFFYKTPKKKEIARHFDRTRRRLGSIVEMFLNKKIFYMRMNSIKQYFYKKLFNQKAATNKQESLALNQFLKASGMVAKILERYHLKPQKIKVDLLRSKNHPAHVLAPSHLGWKKAAKKGVRIHNMLYDNFEISSSPHDKVSARMIQKILNGSYVRLILLLIQYEYVDYINCLN